MNKGSGGWRVPLRLGEFIVIASWAASVFLVSSLAPVQAASTVLPTAKYLKWAGSLETRSLEDESVLNEYVAKTAATEPTGVSMSLRFVPRFQCSPLLGFKISGDAMLDAQPVLQDGVTAKLSVDGVTQDVSLLVDVEADAMSLWTDEEDAQRTRLRRMFDLGTNAVLELPGERRFYFSLLGSTRSSAAVENACLAHVPIP